MVQKSGKKFICIDQLPTFLLYTSWKWRKKFMLQQAMNGELLQGIFEVDGRPVRYFPIDNITIGCA